jgi:glutamate racemase
MEGLIYGCTHYPLASDVIQDVLNKNGKNDVILFNPAFFVSSEIARKVNFDTTIQDFEVKFFVTEISAAARLQQAVKNLFGFIPEIQVADLKKYL